MNTPAKTSGSSEIFMTLRREILSGKFARNEKFPSEQMLVRRFNVARATVSHALTALKNEGILRVKVGSGVYVTPLAKGQGAIGLIVPGRGRGEIFEPICRSIENEVSKLGYSAVSCGTLKGSAEERKVAALAFANACVERHVAGVIMEPVDLVGESSAATREALDILKDAQVPVVLIDRDVDPPPFRSAYDLVGIDNVQAGYRVARHLLEQGAKRLRFLTEPKPASTIRQRIQGHLVILPDESGQFLAHLGVVPLGMLVSQC